MPLADPIDAPAGHLYSVSNDSTAGGCFATRMADHLRANGSRPVGVITAAKGGTAAASWLPAADRRDTSTLFGAALVQAEAAVASVVGSRVRAIIVYQGETTAAENGGALWGSRWTTIVEALRAELGSDIAVIVVRLPVDPPSVGAYHEGWENVRTAQTTFQAGLPNSALVQAPPATLDGEVHLDTGANDDEGHRKLGIDVATAILAL